LLKESLPRAKTLFDSGDGKNFQGGRKLAIKKEQKAAFVAQYDQWLGDSKAVFFTEYSGLTVKQFDELRAKLREAGAEYHVLKNTLGKLVFTNAGYEIEEKLFEGSTAVGFAFDDSPAVAKALTDYAAAVELVKLKGGYLGKRLISKEEVKALANLPPMPVVRAQLLGMLQAPAGKLVRTLAEPGRMLAAVIQAFSEKETATA
jgi:large subunit ribosomal protein L10